jgi:hypothetical protein
MSHTLTSAIAVIKAAIQADTDISAYCSTTFGKALHIQIGWDEARPPAAQKCPLVLIKPGARARSSELHYRRHRIDVGVMGIKATATEPNGDISETDSETEYRGISAIDGLANLVEKRVTKALIVNGIPNEQEFGADDEIYHPFYLAQWSYIIRCDDRLPTS